MMAAAGHGGVPLARLRATLDRLDNADAARMKRLLPHLDALRGDGFDRVVEWTIAGLEQMLALS